MEDAGWIADLWNDIIARTNITFTTVPKTPDAVQEMIAIRPVLVLSDATGFATYGPFRAGPGYAATVEHTILLGQTSRGKGMGRHLLEALQDRALQDGVHVMVAGISGANPGAVEFHAKMGFEVVATMPQVGRKSGAWLDLILMQKVLGATQSATASRPDSV
jgi:L-amino acid N-acyltransferase